MKSNHIAPIKKFENSERIFNGIKYLAIKAMNGHTLTHRSFTIAKMASRCPVDYMRYAEFEALLRDIDIRPGMTILDVSSPKWFSIYLANKYPEAEFIYTNIMEKELESFEEITRILKIGNLKHKKADVRNLEFTDRKFDIVLSISVIEHIYPEEDGDQRALSEIKRVLKPSGVFLMTIPYKAKRNIVYKNSYVYERREKKRNFFAREYDKAMFNKLVERSGLSLVKSWFICERKGLFSLDYYQWGPGKNILLAKHLIKSRKLLERVVGKTYDDLLAKQYLTVSSEITSRLVNISTVLRKK